MLFLKRAIRTRIDLLLPEMRSRIQEKIRKGGFEFPDRKFDIGGDHVAVRDYRGANSKWKIGRIINKDGALYYTIDVQGTLLRRHADQIRAEGEKVQETVCTRSGYRSPLIGGSTKNVLKAQDDDVTSTAIEDSEIPTSQTVSSSDCPGSPVSSTVTSPLPAQPNPVSAPISPRPLPRRSERKRKPPERLNL